MHTYVTNDSLTASRHFNTLKNLVAHFAPNRNCHGNRSYHLCC